MRFFREPTSLEKFEVAIKQTVNKSINFLE